jgi:hypothetical protein
MTKTFKEAADGGSVPPHTPKRKQFISISEEKVLNGMKI